MGGNNGIRRKRDRALDHPLRRAILDVIRDHELSVPEICEALPDHPEAALVHYHVTILQDAELVTVIGGLYRRA